MSRKDADDAVRRQPVTITPTEAEILRSNAGIDIYNKVANAFSAKATAYRFEDLPAGAQTAIIDVAYQHGPALAQKTPKFWMQITQGRWKEAVAELSDFGDSFPTRRLDDAARLQSDIAMGVLPKS